MILRTIGKRDFSFPTEDAAQGFDDCLENGNALDMCVVRWHGVEVTPPTTTFVYLADSEDPKESGPSLSM